MTTKEKGANVQYLNAHYHLLISFRKQLIITLMTLTLCGCNGEQTSEVVVQEAIPWTTATEYTYKGHSYIKFGDGHQGGVVHNPECKCQYE